MFSCFNQSVGLQAWKCPSLKWFMLLQELVFSAACMMHKNDFPLPAIQWLIKHLEYCRRHYLFSWFFWQYFTRNRTLTSWIKQSGCGIFWHRFEFLKSGIWQYHSSWNCYTSFVGLETLYGAQNYWILSEKWNTQITQKNEQLIYITTFSKKMWSAKTSLPFVNTEFNTCFLHLCISKTLYFLG